MIWQVTCHVTLHTRVDQWLWQLEQEPIWRLGQGLGGMMTAQGMLYFHQDNPALAAVGRTMEQLVAARSALLPFPLPGPVFDADRQLVTDDLALVTAARLLPRFFTVTTLQPATEDAL